MTRIRFGARVSPHVLVLPLAMVVAIPAMRGAIVSGIHWWWSDTYRQVMFVMDEARPNDGFPYISGHFDNESEPRNMLAVMHGDTMVVQAVPGEAFVPGKRLAVWHSPEAPNFVAFGAEVNDVPVAALPVRPGLPAFLAYLAWLVVTGLLGLGATSWVASRWSRSYGTLPIRRHDTT